MGVRTGNSALLQMKASASVELPPVSTLSIHPLFWAVACASASAPSAAASSYFSSAGRAVVGSLSRQVQAGQAVGGMVAAADTHERMCTCNLRARASCCCGVLTALTRQQPNLLQRGPHIHVVVDSHIAAWWDAWHAGLQAASEVQQRGSISRKLRRNAQLPAMHRRPIRPAAADPLLPPTGEECAVDAQVHPQRDFAILLEEKLDLLR